jgi:2-keto-4-pentenoate hydratase/2-oxohepta-3-ene-1,7-dioic acid hydratase in catechol pathway
MARPVGRGRPPLSSGTRGTPTLKLVTFEVATLLGPFLRVGALSQNGIIDLNMGYARYLSEKRNPRQARGLADEVLPPDMLAFLHAGDDAKNAGLAALEYVTEKMAEGSVLGPYGERILYQMDEVKLRAPVLRPNSLRDFISFEQHASPRDGRVLPEAWYEIPVCYKGNPDSVIGPEDTILWPSFTDLLDYEMEYGIYIGREGRNISREEAERYIAGYTIFNDVSARDIQRKEMSVGLGPAKGKDTCNVMGPCLVTPDEVDCRDMRMIARINGEVWTDGNSGTMYRTWAEIIEYVSRDETLHPGDFFGSGTVGGGCGAEHGRWIKPGDVVELEMEGIGILRNRVGEKGATPEWALGQRR